MEPIRLPPEQLSSLQSAIPFRRPDSEKPAPSTPVIAPFEEETPAGEARPKTKPPGEEPYRKKYKKYGRDVCLPSESTESYDVLSDSFDTSHHSVDKVSPL